MFPGLRKKLFRTAALPGVKVEEQGIFFRKNNLSRILLKPESMEISIGFIVTVTLPVIQSFFDEKACHFGSYL
jgi:hypothetical protein